MQTSLRWDGRGSPSRRLFVAAAVLLLAFGFRVWQLSNTSFWHDEKYTSLSLTGSFADTLESTLGWGNQVPFYFVLLRFFPHTNDFSIHLFSVLAGVLTVAVLIAVVARLFSQRTLGLWAGLVLACNPFHVWYSRMGRAYALLILLSAVTAYLFIQLYRGHRSGRLWILFGICLTLTYLTHYFGLFLGLAQYLTLFATLRQDGRFFRRWIAVQLAACIPLGLWLLAYIRSDPSDLAMGWIVKPSLFSLPRTVWNMGIGLDSALPALTVPGGLASLALIAAGVILAYQARKTQPDALYWVMLLAAPVLVTFLLSEIVPIYIDRYLAEIIPAFAVLPVLGALWLIRRSRARLAYGLLAIVCLSGAANITGTMISGRYERESWDDVAAYLHQHEQAGDVLVVEQTITLDLLLHYYGVEAAMARGVLGINPDEPDPLVVMPPAAEPQRLWVIYLTHVVDPHRALVLPHSDPFEPDSSPVSNWLLAHQDQVVEHLRFNGVQLILLDLSRAL